MVGAHKLVGYRHADGPGLFKPVLACKKHSDREYAARSLPVALSRCQQSPQNCGPPGLSTALYLVPPGQTLETNPAIQTLESNPAIQTLDCAGCK